MKVTGVQGVMQGQSSLRVDKTYIYDLNAPTANGKMYTWFVNCIHFGLRHNQNIHLCNAYYFDFGVHVLEEELRGYTRPQPGGTSCLGDGDAAMAGR